MRTFFAMELTPDVVSKIQSACRSMDRLPGKINWVSPENMHVTMNFVGDVPDDRVKELCEIGRKTAEGMDFDHVEFSNGPLACVPHEGYLRMIWSEATDQSGNMEKLYEALKEPARDFGTKPDRRPFRGHVTVARIKATRRPDEIRNAVNNLSETDFGKVRTEHLVLYSSELKKNGPVYFSLMKAKIGK